MKKLIFILLTGLSSCKNDSVTISTQEYRVLKGDSTLKTYPKLITWYSKDGEIIKSCIIMIDGHEMITGLYTGDSRSFFMVHRPDCVECKKRDTLLNTH